MPLLHESDLHGSLQDPVLGAISFLNEVMGRHPGAISFAPGAPRLPHLRDADLSHYTDVYLEHLRTERGLSEERARRLLHEYGPSRGLINDVVAAALSRDLGVPARPEALVITVGAQEAMVLTLRALCPSPGDLLAVATPGYVGILGAARLLDIGVVAVPDTDRGPDLGALRAACRTARAGGRRVRALYVAPDYANPSGTVMDRADRHALLSVAEEEDLLLLEDGAYAFTAPPGTDVPSLKALDRDTRVIHLGTFAKVCLPGARVGFVVADQPVTGPGGTRLLADDLAALKSMVTVNTSPLSQAVIAGMLLEHGGSLADLGRDRAQVYRENLAFLLDALDRHCATPELTGAVSWNRPRGGFFVRMRLPVPVDTALLERCAAGHGVLWTPMAPFWIGDAGDHELRLSCSYLDQPAIEEGVRRLAGFLHDIVPTPTHTRTRTS
ncbi:GntR family transcriptional regulator [Streptomyces eurocidicus]|uniref:(S)-3,5-dihydroxyphenylglycine transaminase n=1 Tax=Streptomyces eurocidicus TaxID=66423 RepID=A0A2N8NUH1_STREU|nr:PLP-dependent aminotransferase family protein [Streptomyces eurocidicus]MBB5120275.1 (S)-3,5-dihydroxyphenylglycine transaminase [Streptomyces eurocidicus]MBF6056045.1 aminotransferase class I/II-fold pyridoxal phosphate-dependent enzyme [Streptomyces eurocidicus]PNE32417.1 GntR family transcriptional regulator [Streptomyces eurocidicus]